MDDSRRSRIPESTQESNSTPDTSPPLRVVLAENDEAMRQLITLSLSREGFEVTECSNGAELAGVIEGQIEGKPHPPIDVIVSDVQMPGRTGLECLRSTRKFNKQVPFIIITAFGDKRTYEDAFQSGATAVFDKPFDLEALVHAIRQAVSSKE
jgi:two-component system response regulator (stage 0 sporulation protein F)